MSFAQILPLAFVMIAGPQIVSAFFLATSDRWATNSIAYITGAAISITAVVTIAYFVARGAKSAAGNRHSGTVDHVIDWVVLALMLFLIVRVYLTRKTSEPPKWMGRLQTAAPKFAILLGMALLGIFPTDIVASISAGLYVARHADPWWQCLPFVALTLLLLAAPSLTVLLLGKRAHAILPKDPRLDEPARMGHQRDRACVLRRPDHQQPRQWVTVPHGLALKEADRVSASSSRSSTPRARTRSRTWPAFSGSPGRP